MFFGFKQILLCQFYAIFVLVWLRFIFQGYFYVNAVFIFLFLSLFMPSFFILYYVEAILSNNFIPSFLYSLSTLFHGLVAMLHILLLFFAIPIDFMPPFFHISFLSMLFFVVAAFASIHAYSIAISLPSFCQAILCNFRQALLYLLLALRFSSMLILCHATLFHLSSISLLFFSILFQPSFLVLLFIYFRLIFIFHVISLQSNFYGSYLIIIWT